MRERPFRIHRLRPCQQPSRSAQPDQLFAIGLRIGDLASEAPREEPASVSAHRRDSSLLNPRTRGATAEANTLRHPRQRRQVAVGVRQHQRFDHASPHSHRLPPTGDATVGSTRSPSRARAVENRVAVGREVAPAAFKAAPSSSSHSPARPPARRSKYQRSSSGRSVERPASCPHAPSTRPAPRRHVRRNHDADRPGGQPREQRACRSRKSRNSSRFGSACRQTKTT